MTTNMNNPTDQFGEETLFHGRTHPKVLFIPAVIQVLLLALHVAAMRYFPDVGNDKFDAWSGPVIHSLIFAAETWYVIVPILWWRFSSFEVTDTRVRERWGVLYKNTRDIDLNRITQTNEERGIIDRIFGAGTIVIYDAANSSALRFKDVPRFNEVRQILDDARRGRNPSSPTGPIV